MLVGIIVITDQRIFKNRDKMILCINQITFYSFNLISINNIIYIFKCYIEM